MMKINWELNIGNILTIIVVLVAMITGFSRFEMTVASHAQTLQSQASAIESNQRVIDSINVDGTAYSRNALVPKLQRIEEDVREIKSDLKTLIRR